MRKGLVLFILFLFFAFYSASAQREVVINELVMSNGGVMGDNSYNPDYNELVELYNPSDKPVDLENHGLTNDPSRPYKWALPDTSIPPQQRIYLIASGKDQKKRGETLKLFHTNFRLSATGDFVGLAGPDGKWVDSISTDFVPRDHSYGRYPDGSDDWYYFPDPNIGRPNHGQKYPEKTLEIPEINTKGGFYNQKVEVKIDKDDHPGKLYYTLDGSEPDTSSRQYRQSFSLDSTAVLRARFIEEEKMPGEIATATYFIDEHPDLPVISLSTDPDHLWDPERGIYAKGDAGEPNYEKRGGEWERKSHLEFYEPEESQPEVNMPIGLRIHGGKTRQFSQKSLRIYARGGYASFGSGTMDHQFLKHREADEFKRLILRNSGNDWNATMLRSGFQQILHRPLDIAFREYRPAVVYLNGEYWGIHNMRDREDKYFIEREKGYDADSIYMVANKSEVNYGSRAALEEWKDIREFAQKHDLTQEEHYQKISEQLDLSNFATYQAAHIYVNNYDWPGNNNLKYRPSNKDQPWRWIIKDMDFGFMLWHNDFPAWEHNMLAMASEINYNWPNPQWSTALFRNLLENEHFRNLFINKFADHLNIWYAPERVKKVLDSCRNNIKHEIDGQIKTWADSGSYLFEKRSVPEWENLLEDMYDFAEKRPQYQRQHIIERFDLEDSLSLSVDVKLKNDNVSSEVKSPGDVKINDNISTADGYIPPEEDRFPWRGIYFNNIPVELEARPKNGFEFSHWEGPKSSENSLITLNPTENVSLKAVFKRVAQ